MQAAHLYLLRLDPERGTLLSGLWAQYLLHAGDSYGNYSDEEDQGKENGLDTAALRGFVEQLLCVSEDDMEAEVSNRHAGSTCRRIGLQINEEHGKCGLVFVCDAVRARYRMKGIYLEYIFDGIGTFQR